MIFLLLLLVLVIGYALALAYLRQQWLHIPQYPTVPDMQDIQCTISLVIVVRNEAQNLPRLFKALQAQTLPASFFELHLVDDESTDNSLALAEAFSREAKFSVQVHRLVLSKRGGSPKKAAIAQVISQTRGNIIAVTDGDCVPEQEWLSSILTLWQQKNTVFVSGPVRYVGEESLFEQMQSLDFAALIGVGAAMLQAGKPGMCNAANMAFSKKAFIEVGGYTGNEHVPSGDDEFLLQKLAHRYPQSIAFMKTAGGMVSTAACGNWRQFVHQRKRWAGKWRMHKGIATKLVAVSVFMFYLLLALSYGVAIWQPAYAPYVAAALLIKGGADYWFLSSVLHFLKKPLLRKVFLIMELVYPFYVLFFAVAANTGLETNNQPLL